MISSATSELVRADREGKAPLEPDRPRLVPLMALVVASEGGHGPVAVLELVVGGTEAVAPPAGLEERQQTVEGARPGGARVLGPAVCA